MNQLNNISTPKGRKVFSRRILFFSFFILAVIALALGLWLKRTMDQEIKQDNIEKEITTEKEKGGVRNLHKKYKDMIGWIEIKDTGFSYPVMQTGIKGHHEGDWQYYLHRDVHGDYSFYGTPFLDVRCKTDSDNLIIYGHNINGRRYFGYLQNKAEMEGVKQGIFNMKAFLNSQTAEIEEYDEQLVRRLIAKFTVFDDKFEVELKSGLSVDIRRSK